MTPGGIPALDAILKAHALRTPDALALLDPPDCGRVTGKAPRRWTYRQADRAVDAIAGRLREIGLAHGTVVGLQMPNTAIGVLALLAIMRAGMVPAPLPLLWRRGDCVAALSEAGARAIVTCGRVGGFDHAALALEVAAEMFPIRAVCGFGCDSADGIVPLDDLLDGMDEQADTILPPGTERAPIALVTFETTAGGVVPVARDAAQLLAGGRLIRQRGQIGPKAVILSTIPATTHAGVSAALVPWLLSGATLVLHLPFEPAVLRAQIEDERCSVLVVPDAMLPGLSTSGWLDPLGVRSVIAVWRAPERFANAPQWTSLDVTLIDVAAFGETALLAARREPSSRTLPWPIGPVTMADGRTEIADVAITPGGTLAVRGALAAAPYQAYGSDQDSVLSPADRHIDTGYPCRLTAEEDAVVVTAPPPGLVTVGGYRFAMQDLQHLVRGIDGQGVLAALPHALAGHRLAGHATDLVTMRGMLETMGINPLLTAAFRDRAA